MCFRYNKTTTYNSFSLNIFIFMKKRNFSKLLFYTICEKDHNLVSFSLFFVFYFISFWLNAHATIKQSFWHIITTLLQNVCGTYNNLNYENVIAKMRGRPIMQAKQKSFSMCVVIVKTVKTNTTTLKIKITWMYSQKCYIENFIITITRVSFACCSTYLKDLLK